MTANHEPAQGAESPYRTAAAAAIADVDALGVDPGDREVVLKALLQARLGGFVAPAPVTSPAHGGGAGNGVVGGGQGQQGLEQPPVEDGDVLGKIAQTLKIDRDTVELVYALQDGEPQVVVSAKKISTNKSLATRHLGQLVAAARQIAGIEEWTTASTIRPVVADYGRIDSNNFAASLQQMDNVALVRGKGQQREVKITKPGYETTGGLIKSLVGGDS